MTNICAPRKAKWRAFAALLAYFHVFHMTVPRIHVRRPRSSACGNLVTIQ